MTVTESQIYRVMFVQKNSFKNNLFSFSRALLVYAKTKKKENSLLN